MLLLAPAAPLPPPLMKNLSRSPWLRSAGCRTGLFSRCAAVIAAALPPAPGPNPDARAHTSWPGTGKQAELPQAGGGRAQQPGVGSTQRRYARGGVAATAAATAGGSGRRAAGSAPNSSLWARGMLSSCRRPAGGGGERSGFTASSTGSTGSTKELQAVGSRFLKKVRAILYFCPELWKKGPPDQGQTL